MSTESPHGRTRRLERKDGWLHLVELPVLKLVARSGPQAGRKWTLSLPSIRIGSDPGNDLVLEDDATSRFHARICRGDLGLVLEDLGSTNGTWVNGVRTTQAVLEAEFELGVGESTILVQPRKKEYYAPPSTEDRLGGLVGRSPVMREVYGLIQAVAATPATVLVQGESGTGKELVARAVHDLSGRKGPLIVFDCASTSADLLRSELFGHEKGAFTGAEKPRQGAFRKADRGTLFLDELGELPLTMQPNLLRVLENREVQPVGSDDRVPVDVRLVAATSRDLEAMVRAGTFREDLLHRLAVIRLRLPPLRERSDDIPLLVDHFVEALGLTARFGPESLESLRSHPWPGNIRGLRNVIEMAGILCAGREVRRADLKFAAPAPEAPAVDPPGPSRTLEDLERDAILTVLERTGGNKAEAARQLGIGLSTLKRKLKGYQGQF